MEMLKKIKFIIFALTGTIVFFCPIYQDMVLIMYWTNIIKMELASHAMVLIWGTVIASLINVNKNFFKERKLDDWINIFFSFSTIISIGIVSKGSIFDTKVQEEFFSLIYTIIITTFVSGTGVFFLLRSGLIEFVAVLINPIMRKIFLLPGRATVDCLASFVASPSVGIYFTNVCYEESKYTQKEACAIASNFSVVSLGFIGSLVAMCGIERYYNRIVFISFLMIILLAIITIRMYPLSNKEDIDKNKRETVYKDRTINNILFLAVDAGMQTSESLTLKEFYSFLKQTLFFVEKMVILMVFPLAFMLFITNYTSMMSLIGKPFESILIYLNVPDAQLVAPTILLGFIEVALPTMSIVGSEISAQGAAFVVILSIVQVIFMTETGLVILSSSIPLSFRELLILFLERTILTILILPFFVNTFIG